MTKYFIFLILLFFTACSTKNYKQSASKVISIKTPLLKFSDLGYVKKSEEALRLELFVAGKNVQNIEINYLICVDDGCLSKRAFNKRFLNEAYPDDILKNIVLGHTIYDAKNVAQDAQGFHQEIKDSSVNIYYRVSPKEIYFKDKKNHILFKIKDIN